MHKGQRAHKMLGILRHGGDANETARYHFTTTRDLEGTRHPEALNSWKRKFSLPWALSTPTQAQEPQTLPDSDWSPDCP
jgi:hypothetical protein